jgi:hypothetical protein
MASLQYMPDDNAQIVVRGDHQPAFQRQRRMHSARLSFQRLAATNKSLA